MPFRKGSRLTFAVVLLYAWDLRLAERRQVELALATVLVTKSSFFPCAAQRYGRAEGAPAPRVPEPDHPDCTGEVSRRRLS